LARWQGHLETVELSLGKVLYEPGDKQRFVYFPTTAIVSLLLGLENGSAAEIAVAGREGLVGISLFMEACPPPAGQSFRAPGTRSG
jgi:hypothetical protein